MTDNYIPHIKSLLASGFTQQQLAKLLGVTFAALNRWIHGYARPQDRRLVAIERLYKERIGYPDVNPSAVQKLIHHAESFRYKGIRNIFRGNVSLQEDFLLEHTYNSTSIEGTTFTLRETESVIFSRVIIPEKTLVEHFEVTNHAVVLRDIFEGIYTGPITEEIIKELHKGLMKGIRNDAGKYSRHPRAIRGVNIALTHPDDIPEEMSGIIQAWTDRKTRKSIKDIAVFHIQFELIHPFGDGNGRVGRLIMAYQCLQTGYLPVIIENSRKAEYYDVLEYGQRKSEGPFIQFMVEEMERTEKIFRKHLY